jgi:hypothetical protein
MSIKQNTLHVLNDIEKRVFSFVGTFLLSIRVSWQNYMIKIENDKHTHYLE